MSDSIVPYTTMGSVLPEFLRGADTSRGFLHDDAGLMAPPRVKLLSGMSRQVKDGLGHDGEFWSDAHGGVVAGVTKRKPLEVTSLRFVPIHWQRSWAEFDRETMRLLWQTQDPDDQVFTSRGIDEQDKWKYAMLLLALGCWDKQGRFEFGVYSFLSTAFKVGRNLYRTMKRSRVPLCAQVWSFGVEEVRKEPHSWFAPVPQLLGVLTDRAVFERCQAAALEFKGQAISVEEDRSPEPDSPKEEAGDELPF